MGNKQKEKKKKIRFKGLLIVILFLYLFGSLFYYLVGKPIRNINIEGNSYFKDSYLIDYLDLKNLSILKVSKSSIKKKLLEIDLISDVKVDKNYLGKLNITVVEEKVLFYNSLNKKIVLSNGEEISNNSSFLGVPTLINRVDDKVYSDLIKSMRNVNKDVLMLISEIEYNPSIINNKTIDETRFIFYMNDGNKVYINTINMEKINNYLSIYEAILNKSDVVKGCLYLDSNSENNHFNTCGGNENDGSK